MRDYGCPRGVVRRTRRRLSAAVILLFLGAFVLVPPADACACGGVFVPPDSTSSVPTEEAMVVHVGDTTEVTMRLHLRSDADEAGLVVPTPAPATVRLGAEHTFSALDRATEPETKDRWHLVGGDSDDGVSSGGARATPPGTAGGVQELSTVDLGPLRATTLKAGDSGALRTWLVQRGYTVRPAVQQVLDEYVREGWSFVAMQLTPEGKKLDGDLPPIAMSYADARFVYPMRMSRAATNSPVVTTYVFSDHRVQRSDATARVGSGPHLDFAADLRAHSGRVGSALRPVVARAPFLTVFSQRFADPATQLVSDFTFARAGTDDEHIPVRYRDRYLFSPTEFGAALTGTLLLVAAGLVFLGRRRRAGD